MKSRFYTAQEVAEMLGVHQSTAYKIIKACKSEKHTDKRGIFRAGKGS